MYRLVLPPHLHKNHNVARVFVLQHYATDESHKLSWKEPQVLIRGDHHGRTIKYIGPQS